MCGAQNEKKKMADQTMPELLLNDPIVTIFVKTEILEEKLSLKIKCMLTVFQISQHLLNPLPIKDLKFTKDNQ